MPHVRRGREATLLLLLVRYFRVGEGAALAGHRSAVAPQCRGCGCPQGTAPAAPFCCTSVDGRGCGCPQRTTPAAPWCCTLVVDVGRHWAHHLGIGSVAVAPRRSGGAPAADGGALPKGQRGVAPAAGRSLPKGLLDPLKHQREGQCCQRNKPCIHPRSLIRQGLCLIDAEGKAGLLCEGSGDR